MRKILFAAALAVASSTALAACAGMSAPAMTADATVLDEKAAITAETAYTAASRLGGVAARLGAIDKARFKTLDMQAYMALLSVRSAYRAGNAGNLAAAIGELNGLVGQIRDLAHKENDP
jgi:hypothetical protein